MVSQVGDHHANLRKTKIQDKARARNQRISGWAMRFIDPAVDLRFCVIGKKNGCAAHTIIDPLICERKYPTMRSEESCVMAVRFPPWLVSLALAMTQLNVRTERCVH